MFIGIPDSFIFGYINQYVFNDVCHKIPSEQENNAINRGSDD